MASYAPPSGPPPPHVPAGWKAVWNEQYKEWFFVNTYTKESTWEKPTQEAHPTGDGPPPGAPPAYDQSFSKPAPTEKGPLGSNNPYGGSGESDEALARRLQAEENQRGSGSSPQPPGSRGEASGYYAGQQYGSGQQYGTTPQGSSAGVPPPQDAGKKGLFSKLTGKIGGGSQSRPPQSGYGPPPGQYGSGYPQQGYSQYGQQQPGYGQYPPQQGYGYATQGIPPPMAPQYAQQAPARKHGGMGALGGGALGLGAGLLGGALIGEAIEGHDGGDGGGFGGDDGGYGGGDYGGDGGDFGGGDGGGGDF